MSKVIVHFHVLFNRVRHISANSENDEMMLNNAFEISHVKHYKPCPCIEVVKKTHFSLLPNSPSELRDGVCQATLAVVKA